MDTDFDKSVNYIFRKTKRYAHWRRLRNPLSIYNNARSHRQRCRDDRDLYIMCRRFKEEIIKFKKTTRFLTDPDTWDICPPGTVLYHIDDILDHENLRLKLNNITYLNNYRFVKYLPFVIREIIKFMKDCDIFFVKDLTELLTTGIKSEIDSLIGKFAIKLKV